MKEINTGKAVIETEIKALNILREKISTNFKKAVV